MPKIAILLHGSIKSDYRVIKTMRTLAQLNEVHLYYCGNTEDVRNHFDGFTNIQCYPLQKPKSWTHKILAHSYFCYEYNFMIAEVVKSNTPYDIIWANDLPTLNAGAQIAKRLNAKLVYDSHEIFVETLNQFFIKGSNPVKNFIFDRLLKIMCKHGRKIEAQLLSSKAHPNVDLMFTVNESLKNYFRENYGYQNIEVLMNLPYSEEVKKEDYFDFRKSFGWSTDSVVVLYQGALNRGRGLELLLDAALLLPDEYKIVVLGNGLLKNQLILQVQKLNLQTTVAFMEAVPLDALPKHTVAADLGINLLETFNLSKKLASPNKLFEYIHAEIPVVASNTIENKKVFDQFQIGSLCENKATDIAEKIQLVAAQKTTFVNALREAKKKYSWEMQEENLLKTVQLKTMF